MILVAKISCPHMHPDEKTNVFPPRLVVKFLNNSIFVGEKKTKHSKHSLGLGPLRFAYGFISPFIRKELIVKNDDTMSL